MCPGAHSEFQAAISLDQGILVGWKSKTGNSLLNQWWFEFWSSSPVHLLLFTFQSSQIAVPCVLSRIYSYIQWDRQSEVCLQVYHLTQDWSNIACFNCCKGLNVSVPPQLIYVEALTPEDGIWRWDLWITRLRWGHEDRALMTGLMPF